MRFYRDYIIGHYAKDVFNDEVRVEVRKKCDNAGYYDGYFLDSNRDTYVYPKMVGGDFTESGRYDGRYHIWTDIVFKKEDESVHLRVLACQLNLNKYMDKFVEVLVRETAFASTFCTYTDMWTEEDKLFTWYDVDGSKQ